MEAERASIGRLSVWFSDRRPLDGPVFVCDLWLTRKPRPDYLTRLPIPPGPGSGFVVSRFPGRVTYLTPDVRTASHGGSDSPGVPKEFLCLLL